jgi:hypothetical protein
MRTDDKNTISGSSYGRSNLPFSVTAHSTVNNYLYDANNGRIYNENVGSTEKYYLRSASGATIGTYNISDTEWEWEVAGSNHIATLTSSKTQYYEYDHLGGVRTTYVTSINCSTSVVNYNVLNMSDYYANGKLLRNFAGIALDQYGYQGSEREHAISDNDYYTLFRGLDVDIVRWKQIDPLAYKFFWQSPYLSMNANPLSNTDITGSEINVDDLKTKDEINKTDNTGELVNDLQDKTGYSLFIDNNGNLQIDKTAGVKRDENGKKVGSATARRLLKGLINSEETFYVDNTTEDTHYNPSNKTININFDKMKLDMSNAFGINKGAYGAAMTFFHEGIHALLGYTDPNQNNPKTLFDKGATVKMENKILKQLGSEYGQRYTYSPIGLPEDRNSYLNGGNTSNYNLKYIDTYIPYDRQSFDDLKSGKCPTGAYILIKTRPQNK